MDDLLFIANADGKHSPTPLQRAIVDAMKIRDIINTYLPEDQTEDITSEADYIDHVNDTCDILIQALAYTPCKTQWDAAGIRQVPEAYVATFGDALDKTRTIYGTPIKTLAARTARHSNTVYRWVRNDMIPDPLVKAAALACINPEPGK